MVRSRLLRWIVRVYRDGLRFFRIVAASVFASGGCRAIDAYDAQPRALNSKRSFHHAGYGRAGLGDNQPHARLRIHANARVGLSNANNGLPDAFSHANGDRNGDT